MFKYEVPSAWYSGAYQDKAPVVHAARPFSMISEEGARCAVLLIHGYGGYPGELVRPARDLFEAGLDVYVPRLPGMGTSGEDFKASKWEDWYRVVSQAFEDLEKRYEKVSLLGHSMGTLLATMLSGEKRVDKLVLAAPAFKVRGANYVLIKFLSLFKKQFSIKWQSDPRFHLHYEGAPSDDEILGKLYWSYLYLEPLLELMKLRRKAVKRFPELTTETLILTSGHDSATDPSVVEPMIMKRKAGRTELVHLPNATHYIFYDIDTESEDYAVDKVVEFLAGTPSES